MLSISAISPIEYMFENSSSCAVHHHENRFKCLPDTLLQKIYFAKEWQLNFHLVVYHMATNISEYRSADEVF